MRKLEKYLGEEFSLNFREKAKEEGLKGVNCTPLEYAGVSGLEVTLERENDLKRKEGKYFTFELSDYKISTIKNMETLLVKALKKMLPSSFKSLVVLGMGNDLIISDSLGPQTVKKLDVLEIMGKKDFRFYKFCPSVFSVTGFESFDLVRAVVEIAEADVVIVVDSLCTNYLSRIGTSFQVTDAGIVPGSAVGNNICDLTQETLNGAKVISIGVPMVIYLDSVMEEVVKKINPPQESVADLFQNFKELDIIFAPKDVDFLVDFSSKIVSRAIFESI